MIGLIAGFLLPAFAATMLARRLAAPGGRMAIAVPLAGIAMGLASVVGFALIVAGLHSRWGLLVTDAAIWIAVAVAALRVRRSAVVNAATTITAARAPRERLIAVAIGVLLLGTAAIATVWFVASSGVYPHGEWDAWAQWNLRARFFFRGFADGTWRNAFASVLAWSHPDYPLLVPVSVARLWLYGGTETVLAPIVFGGAVAVATASAVALAVARTRGAARGCFAAAVLLACPSFVRYSAAQCADLATGFFIVSAFILWARADEASGPGQGWHWILAGAAAALAGWTKNEGLAACGIVLVIAGCERWWSTREVGAAVSLLAGAAPLLLVVIAFKLTLAPPSYFTSEQSLDQAIASLTDGGRIRLVADAFARELWTTGATTVGVLPILALFAVIRGIDASTPVAARAAIPAMLLLLAVYAAAYLVTPKDLVWQLQTSLDRLVLQVVPTLTWATVTLCR